MLFYWFTSLFVLVVSSLNRDNNKFIYLLLFFILWFVAGTSNNFSIDYPAYKDMYDSPDDPLNADVEPVWNYITDMIRHMGFASRGWFMFTSLLIVGTFFYGIRKMSIDPMLSVLMFVVCFFYFESLNGIRQYAAIGILFAFFHYVLEGKIWRYALIVLIAAQFHRSAYVLLPFVFLLRIRWSKYLLGAILIFTFFYGTQLMTIALEFFLNHFAGSR